MNCAAARGQRFKIEREIRGGHLQFQVHAAFPLRGAMEKKVTLLVFLEERLEIGMPECGSQWKCVQEEGTSRRPPAGPFSLAMASA